jgi:hypothetical protein
MNTVVRQDSTFRPSVPPARRGGLAWLTPVVAALLAFAPPAGSSGDAEPEAPDTTNITGSVQLAAPGSDEVLPGSDQPFRVGESLRFSVQYGFIKAGQAWLEVPQVVDVDGRRAYTLVARAESNAFFSAFYKVRNRIESVWDRDGLTSLRFSENRREGGYRAQNEIRFDPDRGEATYRDGESYPVPSHVQDALSSFYYTRFQPLPLGGSVVFDYHASRKTRPLEVKVLGRERITTPAGTFDCVVIEPILKAGGIFKKSGRLVIWLTDDERRMPVLMKSKVTVGSISVVLQEARSGA